MSLASVERVRESIRGIPDFPKPGILFRDMMPLLKDPALFEDVLDWCARTLAGQSVDYIIGIESRGFILGAPLAQRLGVGFVPARKQGKLPGLVERHEYDLEYGTDCVEMQTDAFPPGSKVVIIDDLLATGGTVNAAISLARKLRGEVVSVLFLIELTALNGRHIIPADIPTFAMIDFTD